MLTTSGTIRNLASCSYNLLFTFLSVYRVNWLSSVHPFLTSRQIMTSKLNIVVLSYQVVGWSQSAIPRCSTDSLARLNLDIFFAGIGIPIIKIKRSHERRIFIMVVPYLERPPFYWDWAQGLCYYHGLTLIPAWISNHMPGKVWDKIAYPFHRTLYDGCNYLFMLGIKLIHVSKRGPMSQAQIHHPSIEHKRKAIFPIIIDSCLLLTGNFTNT